TVTTRPSTAGKAPTTSWSMRPKVAPTWSAIPADAGGTGESNHTATRTTAQARRRRRVWPARISEHDGRLVDTEDPAQGRADLAEGGARAHRVEDRGEQVGAAARRRIDGGQAPLDGAAIARRAQALEALGEEIGEPGIQLKEVVRRGLLGDELVD